MFAPGPPPAFLDTPLPLAMAHRGGAGYGPNVGIENTVRAFATALDLGYRYLETDVRATRDGVAVVVHDDALDRLCGVPARVSGLTWEELSRLRVGGREPLPHLAEVLAAFPHARLNIDVKSDDAVQPTLQAIRAAGASHRVCLATFSDTRIRRIRALAGPAVATACSSGEVALLRLGPIVRLRAMAAGGGAVAAQVPRRSRGVTVANGSLIRHAHQLGLQVHVWTVDDTETMRAMLDLGVDGLITDRVDVLADFLRVREDRPP